MPDKILHLESSEDYNYSIVRVSLATARTDNQYATGLKNCVLVRAIDDVNANFRIKFDRTDNEPITLVQGDLFMFKRFETNKPVYFDKIYISNAVGVGYAELCFTQNIEFARRLRFTSDIISTALLQQVITVGIVATLIPVTPLTGRINILVYNSGANTIYLGSITTTAAGVTQGIPLAPLASLSLTISAGVNLYGIVAAATEPLNILEGA